MALKYIKAPIVEVSLESYEKFNGGFDDDEREVQALIGEEERELYMRCLTRRQRQVAELMAAGYKRDEIARNLTPQVCVQAVHQIVLRIRKRLEKRAGIPKRK